MNLDNYDLSTIHYALFYYMDNADLDEDEMEWIGLLREKVDSIMVSQMNYDTVSYTHLTLPTIYSV